MLINRQRHSSRSESERVSLHPAGIRDTRIGLHYDHSILSREMSVPPIVLHYAAILRLAVVIKLARECLGGLVTFECSHHDFDPLVPIGRYGWNHINRPKSGNLPGGISSLIEGFRGCDLNPITLALGDGWFQWFRGSP